jgi:hypothetical protein
MAKEDFCFTYYDGDSLRDMSHMMDRVERGAYHDILLQQRKFGHLTIDQIKRFLGRDFEQCWPSLEVVMRTDDQGKYFVEWLENSILKMRANSKKQSEKGSEGGKAKARNYQTRTKSVASDQPNASQGVPVVQNSNHPAKPLEDGNVYEGENGLESETDSFGKCENLFIGDVPADVAEFVNSLNPSGKSAKAWQIWVQLKLISLGYKCELEVPVYYQNGRKGRVDIVATKGNEVVAIECDNRTPRSNSIAKIKENFACGMVLLRDPKIIDQGEEELFPGAQIWNDEIYREKLQRLATTYRVENLEDLLPRWEGWYVNKFDWRTKSLQEMRLSFESWIKDPKSRIYESTKKSIGAAITIPKGKDYSTKL